MEERRVILYFKEYPDYMLIYEKIFKTYIMYIINARCFDRSVYGMYFFG